MAEITNSKPLMFCHVCGFSGQVEPGHVHQCSTATPDVSFVTDDMVERALEAYAYAVVLGDHAGAIRAALKAAFRRGGLGDA